MSSTRVAICLVLSLFFVASQCNGEEGYKPSPKCTRNECPSYTVVHSQPEFEIRSYKDAQWMAGPKIHSTSYKQAASKGFKMLLGYIKGENDQHVKINMTSPLLVGVEGTGYTVYFYLPEKYQKSAPKPTMAIIKEVTLPGFKYAAVRRFDGLLNDATIPKHVEELKKSLMSTDYEQAATRDQYMVASYNSPMELNNRVNEIIIWFN